MSGKVTPIVVKNSCWLLPGNLNSHSCKRKKSLYTELERKWSFFEDVTSIWLQTNLSNCLFVYFVFSVKDASTPSPLLRSKEYHRILNWQYLLRLVFADNRFSASVLTMPTLSTLRNTASGKRMCPHGRHLTRCRDCGGCRQGAVHFIHKR